MEQTYHQQAAEWDVERWFNTRQPLSVEALQGKVIVLQAFLYEYRIPFPVAVDQPGEQGGLPRTMRAYNMQGTPTLILIDRGREATPPSFWSSR